MGTTRFIIGLCATAVAIGSAACAASDRVTSISTNDTGALAATGAPTPLAATFSIASKTTPDGLITVTLAASLPHDTAGVNDTYVWSAHNNSATVTVTGVTLGSNWGDYCGGTCTPSSPTTIALGPGCAGQGIDEIPPSAKFGAWCTPTTGVTLAPGATVSGSVTLRPGSGGPVNYIVYSLYNDPITGRQLGALGEGEIHFQGIAAPAAVDEQLTGSASTGSPAIGATFNYNYQIKNSGPWGTFGGVTFTDVLPDGVAYEGYAASAGTLCNAVGQTVSCQIPDKVNQNGQSSTISLTVKALDVAQQIVNLASISFTSAQTDANTANNSLAITVTSK